MFRGIIDFCKIRRSTVRYYPFTYRGKNEVLLVYFLKIFSPHLSSHRDRAFFYMISENKLFLLEMTKTAMVRLTESVRTIAVFTIHFF